MIGSHQLIKSSMTMLAEGVGACSRAMGILSTIATKRDEDSSVTSKSVRLSFTAATVTENDEGNTLAHRIMEHAAMVCKFRDQATMKEKHRAYDAIQSELRMSPSRNMSIPHSTVIHLTWH
jgi:hypothetical protein